MRGQEAKSKYYKVSKIRWLTDDTFSLRMTGQKLNFKAGQHVILSIPGSSQSREYSLYNGKSQSNPEVLVRKIENGIFSGYLSMLSEGDIVELNGPIGEFTIDESKINTRHFVFIASGTGIAPFRSMAETFPELNYQVIHGIRYGNEAYDRQVFHPARYTDCTSLDKTGKVQGRLTKHIAEATFSTNTEFYICGNSNMIFNSLDILKE
ncbi:ferredoxin--NADP reductase [Marinilabilia rubra]|uniref:FAD-binding FR-type domain-containing protein n=1 Tax=Marinilabilia rubra TaxID=2162893 RepID=A0A2U2BE38_9BACT|nr:FAD-binding oxidoreductase [Marinilabilia rubra]PWE01335.1 hypothetical protein DDZ16_02290 [Marinilabilia rubra]